ncbi:ABC transporter permease [Rathayibacter sp. VKM Ac-2801]|uniref:ABC transporter permease n=1 Tax=Rathayibacter sp. VKM Ac-2801 TaxID=2609255 RepID=UPI0013205394|nr:ABC transporter permease [Rathayibacter sp. VKM Ac-2801]QHC69325.1 ABC transporter permease subunit [Rathayibacter sp. VKM Ac-2801]
MSTATTAVRPPRQRGGRAAHPFLRYALRRVLTSLLLVVGVTLVTFILTNLVPGDPVAAALGQRAAEDPEIVAQFRAQYGLDQPLVVQYFTYLGNLLHGDLGVSTTTHNPVVADLAKALPATLEIAFGAIVLSVIIGVLFGTVAAYRRGKASDHVLRVVSLAGLSVPTFWLALVLYYVLYFQLRIAPGSGRLSSDFTTPPTVTGLYTVDALLAGQLDTFLDAASHLFLPVLVLTLYTVGLLTRFVRTAVLEILDQDYVRAARAKGLPNRAVTFSYVLRGASIPILTVVGLAFGSLLSGTVLVEAVFGWPGIGSYAYQAASHLDLRGIMGVGLLIGVMYLLVNLIVDLLYGVLDPRVRLAS